mgnify:CR=1 FL=1
MEKENQEKLQDIQIMEQNDELEENFQNCISLEDPSIHKNAGEKKTTSNLDMENYDEREFPPVLRGHDQEEKSEDCMQIRYNLTADEVRKGLKRFQRANSLKKNIVYTLCCVFIIVVNLYDMIFRQNTAIYTYLFVGVALAIVFILWYSPKRHRDKMAIAIEQEKMDFQMQVYNDHILIKEQQGGLRIRFDNPHLRIFEDEEIFTICPNRERIYILPKRCLENQEKMQDIFKVLGERFVQE